MAQKRPTNPFLLSQSIAPPDVRSVAPLGEKGKQLRERLQRSAGMVRGASASATDSDLSAEMQHQLTLLSDASARDRIAKNLALLDEATACLGEDNVHGMRDAEEALGITIDPRNVPSIPYTKEDFEASRRITLATEGAVSEMLVLIASDEGGSLLTGERLIDLAQAGYEKLSLGRLLANDHWHSSTDFQRQPPLAYTWILITKQCIPGSKNRRHDCRPAGSKMLDQEASIESHAIATGIPRPRLLRPEPLTLLYAIAIHLLATTIRSPRGGERLFEKESHWSDLAASNDEPVFVGRAGASGAHMRSASRDGWFPSLGVCLSR